MLKDFSKVETFLTVVREKSFSKASKKLGISQPAVTQQIKLLEEYLDIQIVDRKKNGIKLTTAGEELYKVALKLEKHLLAAERNASFGQQRGYFCSWSITCYWKLHLARFS